VPLHIQYKDYAVWQQQQLHEPALQSHKHYWLQQFQGELPILSLLTDKPRPAVKTYNGASVQKIIHTDLFKRLQTFNQQQGCTLFMSLVAAVNTLLYRYTQQEDIIIGSVVAGREHADLENQIGFYVNTIALRTLFKGKNSFQELVQNIKQTTLQSYEHQLFPFDELVDALQLKHDTSRNPLFDIMVVLQNTETDHASTRQPIDGLTIHNYEDENRITKFDISFNFAEIQNQLYVHVEYNTDIYEEHTVVQLANHLESLLQAALQQPTTSIQSLKYLSDREESLFKAFNKVEPYFSLDKNIVEHIESKALL
jgi:non-ribosomal peptide synthetase component F